MSGGNWKDLIKASEVGDVAKARYHLSLGVDPNFQHPEYFTAPIFEAVRGGHLELVKILVEEGGADPSLMEELSGDTVVDVALATKRFEILKYLNTKLPSNEQYVLRTVVVTCGNSKSGKEICREMLIQGHSVVFCCDCSENDAIAMKNALFAATNNPNIAYILGDYDSIESVQEIAKELCRRFNFDTLVHNLCVWPYNIKLTDDGLERSFMTNYMVGHILNTTIRSTLDRDSISHIIYTIPEILPIEKIDLNQTPFGKDFHWRKTVSKTVAYGMMSFFNLVEETRDEPICVSLLHAGRAQDLLRRSSDRGCITLLLKMLESLWVTEAINRFESLTYLSQSEIPKHLHGRIFKENGQSDLHLESFPMFDRTNLGELKQWTSDFLSRSIKTKE